jgi:hypothetical protein
MVSNTNRSIVTDDDMHWLGAVAEPVLTLVEIGFDEPGRDGTVLPIDT